MVAGAASLVAVAFTLGQAGHSGSPQRGLLTALALGSVALAWMAVHTVFLLRYARLYYSPPMGGIDFKGERPNYTDFAYLALTIGLTFQVSDTDIGPKAFAAPPSITRCCRTSSEPGSSRSRSARWPRSSPASGHSPVLPRGLTPRSCEATRPAAVGAARSRAEVRRPAWPPQWREPFPDSARSWPLPVLVALASGVSLGWRNMGWLC